MTAVLRSSPNRSVSIWNSSLYMACSGAPISSAPILLLPAWLWSLWGLRQVTLAFLTGHHSCWILCFLSKSSFKYPDTLFQWPIFKCLSMPCSEKSVTHWLNTFSFHYFSILPLSLFQIEFLQYYLYHLPQLPISLLPSSYSLDILKAVSKYK